jgi:hypothetical protein
MANRFPLIVDSSALQIKELPASDNLDLANSSIVNVVDITASGNVTIGGTLTYEDVENIDSVGLVTARTGIRVLAGGAVIAGATTATNGIRVGAGQSIGSDGADVIYFGDGSNLSGLPQSGIGIQTSQGSVGYGVTLLKFVGAGVSDFTTPSSGISTITIVGGGGGGGGGSISTEAATLTNGQTGILDLDSAQDHKVTCSGTVTLSCSGGNEGESHTVRIINSGSATVGFSTFFLFPSGATPTLPTGSGDISLISFTVNRVGAAGTQLLAGASLNFS